MTHKDKKSLHIAGEKADPARSEKLKSALRANLLRRKAKARASQTRQTDSAEGNDSR